MKRKIFSVVCVIFIQFCFSSFISGQILALDNSIPDDSTDQLIIKYKKSTSISQKQIVNNLFFLEKKGKVGKDDTEVVKIKSGRAKDMVQKISRDSRIDFVEPDYKASIMETANDPALVQNLQWGFNKIQVSGTGNSAWNYAKSSPFVAVAIFDTGIDQNHQDLTGKIIKNYNCTTTSSYDDFYGHGTHVAGIVGAVTNNGIGVGGVGYNVSLINAKVLDDRGSGYYSWIANCLYWAADNGAKVINLSLGGSSSSTTLADAVSYAISKGVVVIAAAGNNGNKTPIYPANYPNVISVAATDANDNKASFSNYGTWVDVAAPGVSIYSTMPNHRNSIGILNYGSLSGTSMATPYVSGLAGLLMAINGDSQTVKKMIEDGADHIAGTGTYWLFGRINALNSVNLTVAGAVPMTPTAVPLPTATNIPTPTETGIPTNTPTQTPIIPTNTNTPTPTKTPSLTPTPTLTFWCRINPRYCK